MHDSKLERLVFFSDAVIAIAITLLVIEIHIPQLPESGEWRPALRAVMDLTPQFIGYFVSFLVIGSFWAMHHRIFGMVARHHNGFMWPNLQLLMLIAFIPFATAFMSDNNGQLVPHVFYSGTLLTTGLLQMRLGHTVLRRAFVDPHVPPAELVRMRRRMLCLPAAALLSLCVAFVLPAYSNFTLILFPLLVRLQMSRPITERDIATLT